VKPKDNSGDKQSNKSNDSKKGVSNNQKQNNPLLTSSVIAVVIPTTKAQTASSKIRFLRVNGLKTPRKFRSLLRVTRNQRHLMMTTMVRLPAAIAGVGIKNLKAKATSRNPSLKDGATLKSTDNFIRVRKPGRTSSFWTVDRLLMQPSPTLT